MTVFSRLNESGEVICNDVSEDGSTIVGGIDEWGRLIQSSGRLYVSGVVSVGDIEKHGRCFTRVEPLWIEDVMDEWRRKVIEVWDKLRVVDKVRRMVVRPMDDSVYVADASKRVPIKKRLDSIVLGDMFRVPKYTKMVKEWVKIVDRRRVRVKSVIWDAFRVADDEIKYMLDEWGNIVIGELTEWSSLVVDRLDEMGNVVNERVTGIGLGVSWHINKVMSEDVVLVEVMKKGLMSGFKEGIKVVDNKRSEVKKVGEEIVSIVDSKWVLLKKWCGDIVDVGDSQSYGITKMHREVMKVKDWMGGRTINVEIRDGLAILDNTIRETLNEWGQYVHGSLDEWGQYVVGVYDEVGNRIYVRTTVGGSLEWFITKVLKSDVTLMDMYRLGWLKKYATDVIKVKDNARKKVRVAIDDVITIVDEGWAWISRVVIDSIGLYDIRNRKVVKGVRDFVEVMDKSSKDIVKWFVDGVEVIEGVVESIRIKVLNELAIITEVEVGKCVGKAVRDVVGVADKVCKCAVGHLLDGISMLDVVTKDPKRLSTELVGLVDSKLSGVRKVVKNTIGLAEVRLAKVTTRFVDRFALLDSDVVEWLNEMGLYVYDVLDEIGSRVSGVVDEWGMRVDRRVTVGGSVRWHIAKVFGDVVELGDSKVSAPRRVVWDIVRMADRKLTSITKMVSEFIQLVDVGWKRVELIGHEVIIVVDGAYKQLGVIRCELVRLVETRNIQLKIMASDLIGLMDIAKWRISKIFKQYVGLSDVMNIGVGKVVQDILIIIDKRRVNVKKGVNELIMLVDSGWKNIIAVGTEIVALVEDRYQRMVIGRKELLRLVEQKHVNITTRFVDGFMVLDGSIRRRISEWGNCVYEVVDEFGNTVGMVMDEWASKNFERVTAGGGLYCRVQKRFNELVTVDDLFRKLIGKVLHDVVSVVDWFRKKREEVGTIVEQLFVGDFKHVGVDKINTDTITLYDAYLTRIQMVFTDSISFIDETFTQVKFIIINGVRLVDKSGKNAISPLVEVITVNDWTRRLFDCVIGWKSSMSVSKVLDGLARVKFGRGEVESMNRDSEVYKDD